MKRILVLVFMLLFLGYFASEEYAAAADRFVNNKDGTVTDTQTGLMWADHDNGSNTNWDNAESICRGYSGGGKSGWRMPAIDELWQLYNSSAYGSVITKSGRWVWSSETSSYGPAATAFDFDAGGRYGYPKSEHEGMRALPVRSDK